MESMDNNRINLDLSLNIEYSVEDVSSKNGSSEIIISRNIIDEVEEIGISEKENILISSQNIEINGFLQVVMVTLLRSQILFLLLVKFLLVRKKHLYFIRDMHINTGSQFEKVDSSNKMEL